MLNCRRGQNLSVFRALQDQLERIRPKLEDALKPDHVPLYLPLSSFHVTVWGGIDDGNVDQLTLNCQSDFTNLLGHLPASLLNPNSYLKAAPHLDPRWPWSPLPHPVSLRFKGLSIWPGGESNSVLAARFESTDSVSDSTAQATKDGINVLNERWKPLGKRTYRASFHVSLAYFAHRNSINAGEADNVALCDKLTPAVKDEWEPQFRDHVEELLTFSSVSLYGFTDMATFFRRA